MFKKQFTFWNTWIILNIHNKPINNNDPKKRATHVRNHVAKTAETRITFFREKDDLGFNFYKFVGVFVIDKTESLKHNKCVWLKISDEYTI